MSRQRIIDDKAAQICWKYLHGEFDEKTNVAIHDIVHHYIDNIIAITMIFEIAYSIGYAKSNLMDDMSEVTYKKKKKRIRDELVMKVNCERRENGT